MTETASQFVRLNDTYSRYLGNMRAGPSIIVISITLLMLGVVMVNSAGMQISEDPMTFRNMLTSRPMLLAFFAMVAMFAGSRFPLHWFEKKLFRCPACTLVTSSRVTVTFCCVCTRNRS